MPKKVILVDCTRVAPQGGNRLIEHSYYINCEPVAADLQATLQGKPTDQIDNREVIRPERAYRIHPASAAKTLWRMVRSGI